MSLLNEGFEAFMAPENYFNDGNQDCYVILTAVHKLTKMPVDYYGKTGAYHGHAELDALYQFLAKIKWNHNIFHNYHLQITCTAKPCCKYCSAVMGLLKIVPGPDTYKVYRRMGISYSIPPGIRKFISLVHEVPLRRVESELQE